VARKQIEMYLSAAVLAGVIGYMLAMLFNVDDVIVRAVMTFF